MPLFLAWKRPIRNGLKYGQALLRGYPFFYARRQTPDATEQYPYLWSESVTPIPDRGTPEIRQNRLGNLQLAAQRIDALHLDPGQIFSFSDRVGEPTVANGFRAGPVFVRGRVETGVGGGLCLIATNLFRTLLLSGCKILERHCHSIDAYGEGRFYALGQDAAVAYGYKDLIVRNASPVALQLRFEVLPESGVVRSRLWGMAPCPWQVKVESTILKKIPAPEANGIPGWAVQTVRSIGIPAAAQEQSLAWTVDYCATSLYQPCDRT